MAKKRKELKQRILSNCTALKMWFLSLSICFAAFSFHFLPPARCETTFSVFWNAPSESCERKGVKLDLDKFEIQHNPGLKFKGKNEKVNDDRPCYGGGFHRSRKMLGHYGEWFGLQEGLFYHFVPKRKKFCFKKNF